MIDETVTVDANGNWDFQVPQNLTPGTYKITLKGTDVDGNPLEKPYTFTVNASASVGTPLPSTGIISSNLLLWIAIVILLMVAISVYFLRTKTFEDRLTTQN